MKLRSIFIVGLFYLAWGCKEKQEPQAPIPVAEKKAETKDSVKPRVKDSAVVATKPAPKTGPLEQKLIDHGLANIQEIDSTIYVELKYTTKDNFLKEDVYGVLENAYLQPDVARKLSQAQQFLQQEDSTLSLLVYDGVRPRSVQQKMWDIVDLPMAKKVKFVSNPKNGSLHNFGAAVDLTILNTATGEPLDMGAGFDDPRIEAWPVKEKEMLEKGRITEKHVANRRLLRTVMSKAGFFNIQSEWWHFNACTRSKARELYEIVE